MYITVSFTEPTVRDENVGHKLCCNETVMGVMRDRILSRHEDWGLRTHHQQLLVPETVNGAHDDTASPRTACWQASLSRWAEWRAPCRLGVVLPSEKQAL
jgi:hypothetical protein